MVSGARGVYRITGDTAAWAESVRSGRSYPASRCRPSGDHQLLVRTTSNDSAATMLLYTTLIGAVVMGLTAPFQWVAPDAQGWALLVALGIIGSVGHWLLIRAIQSEPASSLQSFHYTILLWATLVGYLFFDELPDLWIIADAGLVVSGGLYVWQRERQIASA